MSPFASRAGWAFGGGRRRATVWWLDVAAVFRVGVFFYVLSRRHVL